MNFPKGLLIGPLFVPVVPAPLKKIRFRRVSHSYYNLLKTLAPTSFKVSILEKDDSLDKRIRCLAIRCFSKI